MQFVEFGMRCGAGQLFSALAGGCDQAHRHGFLHSLNDVSVTPLIVPDDVWGGLFIFPVDPRRVGVWRFHDMRISRNDGFGNYTVGHLFTHLADSLARCGLRMPPQVLNTHLADSLARSGPQMASASVIVLALLH